jgi:hypothetical protein
MVVAVIVAAGFILFRPFDRSQNPISSDFQNQTEQSPSNPAPAQFTHPIFNPEEIDWVSPLGESNGGYNEVQPLGGMTINIKKDIAAKGPIEVYAPTDMELVSYSHTLMEPEPEPDWAFHFQINKDISLVVHHIKNASPKIVNAVGNKPKLNDSRTTDLRPSIKFKAGEVIGTTTGTSQARNWNIYLQDKKVKNQFVNQKRYEDSYSANILVNAACIFDYYEDEKIKNEFYKLLGTTKAGEAKSCGNPSTDKKGTLSGLWHLKKEGLSTGEYEGVYANPFSIYTTSDKNITIYEINKRVFTIYPSNPTYKDPKEITNSHCYQLTDNWHTSTYKGYAFFRIDSDMQMSMVYSPSGSCPATFPESQAKTYYR